MGVWQGITDIKILYNKTVNTQNSIHCKSFAKKIRLEEVMDADAAWSRIFLLCDFSTLNFSENTASEKLYFVRYATPSP